MLIDKDGKIVFKGHPANRKNLEEDLEKLANGETLTGEGCAPA
jgi:biopolymer transport protein ExbD